MLAPASAALAGWDGMLGRWAAILYLFIGSHLVLRSADRHRERRRGYPVAPPGEWVGRVEAATALGVSAGTVATLSLYRILEPAESADRTVGVTRESLDRELQVRRAAGRALHCPGSA